MLERKQFFCFKTVLKHKDEIHNFGELVKTLFECILEEDEGADYASALRRAKLEVIGQKVKRP